MRAFSLARPDLPDWTAKLNKAEKDYDEAKQKLEEEFKKENPSDKYIEFLTANLEDAQKDKEHALQMLLQKQSRPSAAQQG